jgi:hypothetical protein
MMAVRQANTISSIERAGNSGAGAEPFAAALSVVLVGGEALYREGVKSLLTRHGVAVLGEFDLVVLQWRRRAAHAGERHW